jgi:hypothetical protein
MEVLRSFFEFLCIMNAQKFGSLSVPFAVLGNLIKD